MNSITYRTPEGIRHGVLVSEGRKYISVLLMDYPLRVQRVTKSEGRFIERLDYPSSKMRSRFRSAAKEWHGGIRGVSKAVAGVIR